MASDHSILPAILPVPRPVIDHHGETLFTPMKEWVEQKRVPPVLLLTGMEGTGKRQIAYFLAQWLLCDCNPLNIGHTPQGEESADAGFDLFKDSGAANGAISAEPCGKCAACQRALHGNWVDFKEILPEEEGGTLKIDQFRQLKGTIGFGAHEGKYRITLIPNADRMTPQAANSLLKLLEEPPPNWIFLMTASDPTLILPTVLSRCQSLRLRPFNARTVEQLLESQGIEKRRASICARISQGSWNKALFLAEDDNWEKRRVLFSFLASPMDQINTLVDWAALEPSHFNVVLDQLESFALDLINHSLNRQDWLNRDGADALEQHSAMAAQTLGSLEHARKFWIERAERIAQARSEALTPMNRKLLIQDVLLPWVQTQVRTGISRPSGR